MYGGNILHLFPDSSEVGVPRHTECDCKAVFFWGGEKLAWLAKAFPPSFVFLITWNIDVMGGS